MTILEVIDFVEVLVFVYLLLGFIFSIGFFSRGLNRVEPATSLSSLGFRTCIAPGIVFLWPLVAVWWWAGTFGKTPFAAKNHWRRFQMPAVLLFALGSLIVIIVAMTFRQTLHSSPAPAGLTDK